MPKKGSNARPDQPRKSFVALAAEATAQSDPSLIGKLPEDILAEYEVREWKHASAILRSDFPAELDDILQVLRSFRLNQADVEAGGGGKSEMSKWIDSQFFSRGWTKKRWTTQIVVDGHPTESPTHEVDCFKNRVALEIEWSNKDPFYDRDLNNFRLLFDLRVISVGVIITKSDELAAVFNDLGIWDKYGTSTTWMSKLIPRVQGGGGGGCPLLVIGIRRSRFVPTQRGTR
ncbi:MAG: restriction endonuclease [Planctomycetes bacterium]|nr:restriction endonuclease [Planctomycetota bacterium]